MDRYALTPLVRWFLKEKRALPWRENPTPYGVWVSETMLQQTQVKTVLPYFERWMTIFPTLKDLAQAEEQEVIKLWEGLGYYSRARNLHQGAKFCVEHFEGEFPRSEADLKRIKGVGPYTLGAILSFAYHKKKAAVDGNVQRVMSRLIGFEEEIHTSLAKKTLEEATEQALPDETPWVAMEALIELGALVCKKAPLCHRCPMSSKCQAFIKGKTDKIPLKKKAPKVTKLLRHALILTSEEDVLLQKGKKGQVMEGLWEFPYFEENLPIEAFGLNLSEAKFLCKVSHTFTRFSVDLRAWELKVKKVPKVKGFHTVNKTKVKDLAFSSGMRKLVKKMD
ncbi:MAG: A/G-specific adenine glycosylase [Chlamydiia bacterium]|nr:A/G-specific adenine glycosylase [Chlamydiia bacterium]